MKKQKKDKNKISFNIFLISILTFFALGVFLAEPIQKIYVKNILKTDLNLFKKDKKDLDLKKFWEVYSLLKEKYYSLDWIKKKDLVDWAIKWMVDAIWDKHSEFMTSKEAKAFNDALSWDFEGIGAVVETNPLWVKIDRILKGSPAKKFWLLKWDIITKANQNKLEWLSVWEAVEKIKWPAWTKVKLEILRVWEKKALEKEITRAKIKIPTVETKEFDDNKDIWYIALNMFWETSSEEFEKALEKFKNKKWIIIDLRENWWWYLTSAVEILSNFIENWKKLVSVKWKNILDNQSYKSAWIKDKYLGKIVILIDWNSASASEITAWALHDYKKAILVWEKSYGKWSVQEPFLFSDWSQIKFTIAKWFTPKWINIDKDWIKPDIEVKFKKQDYDLEECKKIWKCDKNMKQEDFKFFDRQLEKAKEVLKSFIKVWDFEKTIEKIKQKGEKN